jgi:hypothetical protein
MKERWDNGRKRQSRKYERIKQRNKGHSNISVTTKLWEVAVINTARVVQRYWLPRVTRFLCSTSPSTGVVLRVLHDVQYPFFGTWPQMDQFVGMISSLCSAWSRACPGGNRGSIHNLATSSSKARPVSQWLFLRRFTIYVSIPVWVWNLVPVIMGRILTGGIWDTGCWREHLDQRGMKWREVTGNSITR